MDRWVEWGEVDWDTQKRFSYSYLSAVEVSGGLRFAKRAANAFIRQARPLDDVPELDAPWDIVDFSDRKTVLAGPFDTADAAKAAYMLMFGEV